ncbi:MAG: glycerophosphoryl diester phosphodiesterase [Janthinobacterium sp.]|jgi:glycerophosphoryl diester phosphodiesterase
MWTYPKIIAHRGGGKLAPENTLAGLRCALAHGFRAVEFDVMLSQDGIPVVLHDAQLGRTVQGAGKVSHYSADVLSRMDAGSWFGPAFADETVPLFSQFVDYCILQRIWMNIEIKPVPGFEAVTGRIVAQLVQARFAHQIGAANVSENLARVPLLASFSDAALAAAQLAAPAVPRAWLVERIPQTPDDWQAPLRELGACALHVNHQHLTQDQACAVRQAGYGLFCYTVNDAQRARALLSWGVDAFCTDRIDVIGPHFV